MFNHLFTKKIQKEIKMNFWFKSLVASLFKMKLEVKMHNLSIHNPSLTIIMTTYLGTKL
jgi:hypothetical protein